MSDCGVCLCFAGESADDFHQEMRVAVEPLTCHECNRPIAAGEQYQFASMTVDDTPSTYDTCAVCAEIRGAFSCDGEMYGGVFWEDMYETAFEDFTTGCLDRLKTAAAKQYLMERWNEWKFSQA